MTQDTATDHTVPSGKWNFDENVARVFENMLARSIPSYDLMRQLTSELAVKRLLRSDRSTPRVVDLGASRGSAVHHVFETSAKQGVFPECFALEVSPAMLDVMRDRFQTNRYVSVVPYDLRKAHNGVDAGLEANSVSVMLGVLTLMFVPMEHRQRTLQVIYNALEPGGYFLYVEKVLGATDHINGVQTECYYDMKFRNGYSLEEVHTKKESLEGVLVPLTVPMHMDMLSACGFSQIDTYFRHHNFCGILAIK